MGLYRLRVVDKKSPNKGYDALLFVNHPDKVLGIIHTNHPGCVLEKIGSLDELTEFELDKLKFQGIPIPKS